MMITPAEHSTPAPAPMRAPAGRILWKHPEGETLHVKNQLRIF